MGLNGILYTAGRSLETFSAGIQVAGQNVSNANTPGYVREHLHVGTSAPYQSNGLLFGTGANAIGIRQQIDLFLEQQLHAANSDMHASLARVEGYTQLQLILGELGSNDLSSRLNQFLGTINEVVNQPELLSNRQQVTQVGDQLAWTINTMRSQLDRARQSTNSTVQGTVNEANELIQQIATLNKQIVQMESAGLLKSDAGGLRTERLTALNRLSEIMPIQVRMHDNGMIDVHTGSNVLILNDTVNLLETYQVSDRGVPVDQVRFARTQNDFEAVTGELAGRIAARDDVLGGFVDELDAYARALIHGMNRVHSQGQGETGFQQVTATYAVADAGVPLNAAGLSFPIQHGSFEILVHDKTTNSIQSRVIDIDLDGLGGNDTTLNDLQAVLDGIPHVQAAIDTFGKLSLSASPGYEIKFGNDNSGVLAALGINTFFQGVDANSIKINDQLKKDPLLFAVGQGGGLGDNSIAVQMAKFAEQGTDLLGGLSLDEFYLKTVTHISTASSAETAMSDGYTSFQRSLYGQRQQISGVSLDEEAIRIMEMQHGYMAAARIISVIEELFNTLVRM